MKYQGLCLHTNNVSRLTDFYSKVLGLRAEGDENHSTFTEIKLAIWNPGYIVDEKRFKAADKYLTLMFEVDDIDAEYNRLKHLDYLILFTSEPTTYPWGVKAFGFKDPDGNNIDFLSPVKEQED